MDTFAPLIERAFSIEVSEQSYEIEEIVGGIPEFIRGTYYLNGPARFSRGDFKYNHWLDGDGMVCALRFDGGRPHFTNRFVHSTKFTEERIAGRPLFRTFGTAFEGDRLKRGLMLESPVNVSVYPYRQTLLAFGEQGLPVKLDPVTLKTIGAFDFGALNEVTPFAGHPKLDHVTCEFFNFGVAFSEAEACLNFYRFDREGKLHYRKRLPLDYPCSVHDFGLTDSYAVFYLSPYLLRTEKLVREGRSLMDSLNWEPERGSRLLIIRRESGEVVASVFVGNRYCLHLINCFEADNRLIVDTVELDRPIYDQYQIPNLFANVGAGRPVRFTLDTQTWQLADRIEIDYQLAPDFPSIDRRRFAEDYGDFWMIGISRSGQQGRKFFDQLVHVNWNEQTVSDIYQAPPGHYLSGEPIFIGYPHDLRRGAMICQLFDARRFASSFLIFDAFNVARGPVASLLLKRPITFGFHACFWPKVTD